MKNALKALLSLAFAALFMWLAFKNVDFQSILDATEGMSWGWLLPFVMLTLGSHYIRALRWRMLFPDKANLPHRSTLFTGVMFGYLTNIPFPRLGEVTRPVYVAKQIGESNSKIIGTVVLERLVDVASMLIILVFVGIFFIADPQILSNLFGLDVTDPAVYVDALRGVALYLVAGLFGLILLFFVIRKLSSGEGKVSLFFDKIKVTTRNFVEGLFAIRQLENWPLFVLYTAAIWMFYISMTYVPFFMFDFPGEFGLTYTDAVILTAVSAVGISVPTPGGIGSYHLFIKAALFAFYAIPEPMGLAFATISHTATLVVVLISSPLLLALEKYLSLKREAAKH